VGHALRTSTSLGYVAKALQYCHDVISGKIPACKWVKLACERQLSDLTRASDNDPTFPYLFDIAKGERVCFFLEQLPHIEGPLTGQKLRLEPWQCLILTTVFGWVHRYDDKTKGIKAGKRRFRRTYVEVPRGNGKSSMSAGVLLYMLGLDGEGGAQIYSVATSVEQAQAVYRPAENMLKQLPDLQKRFGISISAHRLVVEKTASFARALPYKPGVLDGLNVHLAVVDELHAHKVRTVYEVIESGLGKRDQSLLWTITTAGAMSLGLVRYAGTSTLDSHGAGASSVVTTRGNSMVVTAAFSTTVTTNACAVTTATGGLTSSAGILPGGTVSGAVSCAAKLAYGVISTPSTINVAMTGGATIYQIYAVFNPFIASGLWGLVQIQSDPPQIAASLLDARIIYAGTVWDTPPSTVMSVYAAYLLGTETLMGQVLNELGDNLDARFSPQ
jgi:hypothetical protein